MPTLTDWLTPWQTAALFGAALCALDLLALVFGLSLARIAALSDEAIERERRR